MRINSRIENIFAQALAMDNRGLRNTIHCIGTNIYLLNFDHSMMIRFALRKHEVAFSQPISFNANDYDSSDFDEVDGKIVFRTVADGYERRKICGNSGYDVKVIRAVYYKYIQQASHAPFSFTLSKSCCALLEDELSHTEISVESRRLMLRQRNVYTGTIIEVTPRESGLIKTMGNLPERFGPVGVKTKDFKCLFDFADSLLFLPVDDFVVVRDHLKNDFDAVLAFCKYDEIIKILDLSHKEG